MCYNAMALFLHVFFFLFWIETHRGMEQNCLWISDTQGSETTHHRHRSLRHRWSRSRIWCGRWPCLLFINQTLSETPAKQKPHPSVLLVIILSTSASDRLNSPVIYFQIFGKKSIIWQKKEYNIFFAIPSTQYSSNAFVLFFYQFQLQNVSMVL